jgi:mannose-6-phosphate isomerase-like protein (cupin superfamily)
MPALEITPVVVLPGAQGERIVFRGAEMIFKSPLGGAQAGWTAVDYTLPAGQIGAPLHYHRELTESFYVISGELWMRVGDRELTAGTGSYFLVPPGTPHSFANRSKAPARLLGHASSARHKEFLCELFLLAEAENTWPLRDRAKFVELGNRYDSYYL